ncbi:MAG: phosphoadenosine phosphosulfate reductase [Actinomycetota bacterium]|nr:phosphoadenosine phosphosulfate reductase [Actinomycetota bacterium]
MKARPPGALRELADEAGARFAGESVRSAVGAGEQVLRWAEQTFGDRWAVTDSMSDTVLAHLAACTTPGVAVIFLDTGYHFPETLGVRDAVSVSYDVRLLNVVAARSVPEQDAEHGPRLYERDPDRCCALRKVEPLDRALEQYDAWAGGARREESPTRSGLPVVGWDTRRNKVKINPLAAWTSADLRAYAAEHDLLLNPLLREGFPSIGCRPCTRRVEPGQDPRSGRWPDRVKTECGIHR